MGVRLDWEIDSDRDRTRFSDEDPEAARARRAARQRAMLFVLVVIGLIGGIVAAVWWRLEAVQSEDIVLLRGTVSAEVAALRVGDRDTFLNLQRSATDEWIQRQNAAFDDYQAAFLDSDLQLTGTIRAVTVQDRTARVLIEETLRGQVIVRAWFYWRYEDGWFHVLPDYTFWGAEASVQGERVLVRYRDLDSEFARDLHAAAESWMGRGCAAIGCDGLPALRIDVLADDGVVSSPALTDPLIVPSPYITGFRPADPLPGSLILPLASLLATRWVDDALPVDPLYPADAYYFRQAAISWLVGDMTGTPTNSFFFAGLAARYGESAIGEVLRGLPPDGALAALPPLLGAADVTALDADWRDYLTWWLALESDFIAVRDAARFFALYDPSNPALMVVAQARYEANSPPSLIVVSARQSMAEDGVPQVRALVQQGGDPAAQAEIVFRLVDGTWRRAS